jgi:hypothetical protein
VVVILAKDLQIPEIQREVRMHFPGLDAVYMNR